MQSLKIFPGSRLRLPFQAPVIQGILMDKLEQIACSDKLGSPLSIVICNPGDFSAILEMYDTFMPEAVAQGLPPTDKDIRHRWLRTLLDIGENYASIRQGRVTGHAALLPNAAGTDGEYLVFVGTPHRKRGVATLLTEVAIDRAKVLGLKSMWLTVESDNFRAIKLYRKMGFEFCDQGLSERKMARKI
jgi:GNAT superfamily N-acetyltransferase